MFKITIIVPKNTINNYLICSKENKEKVDLELKIGADLIEDYLQVKWSFFESMKSQKCCWFF